MIEKSGAHRFDLQALVGSGDKIILFFLPFAAVGGALNIAFPSSFSVGGPPDLVRVAAWAVLIAGVALWLWSAALILVKVPHGELITTGPFALVKHPIYTSVALLVLPSLGLLLDSWLGIVLGLVLYAGRRLFAGEEEAELARTFGPYWKRYEHHVKIRWL